MSDPTPAAVQGFDCKLYRNTATYAEPTWHEVTCVRDVKNPLEKAEHDASVRAGGGFEAVAGGLKKVPFDLEVLYNKTDVDVLALLDSWWNDTILDLLILDGSVETAGSTGVRAGFLVTKFDSPQPLDGILIASVTLKPGAGGHKPERHTVTT